MSETEKEETALFDEVGECMYRYRPFGVYYARIKPGGKEIRRRKTNDKHVAKSNLSELRKELGQVDLSEGRISLADLCNRSIRTVQHQIPKTVDAKSRVVEQMKKYWPGDSSKPVRGLNLPTCNNFSAT